MVKATSFRFLLFTLFLAAVIFIRFYNLEQTAVFFWDQSRDLVNIHQYFLERKITLVGPVSEEQLRVFSSFTYYMLMPFAILGKFDVATTSYGAAFFGFLTALLIFFMTKVINKKMLVYIAILVILWFPLVEISRSAWNPYFIPFWVVLGLIFFQFKNRISLFVSGLIFGFSIHHHYLAIFAVGMFIAINTLLAIRNKNFLLYSFMIMGLIFAILPFVIFDLRHPPGLFLTRTLYFNHISSDFSNVGFLEKNLNNFKSTLFYYTHSNFLSIVTAVLMIVLLIRDFKKRVFSLIYAVPFILQIIFISFIADPFTHYFLAGLVFFLAYIIFPRDKIGSLISKLILIILIIGSVFTIIPQLTIPAWSPSIKQTREVVDVLSKSILEKNLKNVNLAVLASRDNQTYGARYRDLLLLKNIRILTRHEYFISDHLFVISESNEDKVRLDGAPEMYNFKNGPLKGYWKTSDNRWRVYLFERNSDNLKKEI